jgi:hypothetical protein
MVSYAHLRNQLLCGMEWVCIFLLSFNSICVVSVLFSLSFNFVLVTGDFCCNPISLGRIKTIIEDSVPGIYVNSLKIGSSIVEVSILSVIYTL